MNKAAKAAKQGRRQRIRTRTFSTRMAPTRAGAELVKG